MMDKRSMMFLKTIIIRWVLRTLRKQAKFNVRWMLATLILKAILKVVGMKNYMDGKP